LRPFTIHIGLNLHQSEQRLHRQETLHTRTKRIWQCTQQLID